MGTEVAGTPNTLGERKLTTLHAIGQSLALGPMFSVGIVLGSVSTGARWNATLSVLIAGLGVLAIGYAVAIFARRFSGAGAVYEYLTHGAHPAVGIFAAGVFFIGSLFLGGGGIYLGLGILGNSFWVEHISNSAPSWWLIALVFLVVTLALNYIGVRIAIGAMLTMSAISFVPMLFLGIVMVVKGGDGGNTLSVFNPGSTSVTTAFNGVLLAILLFVGFEAAASIGEESRDPKRAIPRAILGTVAASAAFFVFMAYAISVGLGRKAVEGGAWLDPAVLDKLSTRYVGSWLGTIIDLVVILDALGLALAICVTIGRGYFALGRDGLLPKVFAKTSRHDTPWVGNLMVVVGGVGLILLTKVASYGSQFVVPGPSGSPVPIFPNDQFATFIMAATVGSFMVELVYVLLAVVAVKLVLEEGGPAVWWKLIVLLIAIATPILGFKGALWPSPHDSTNYNWVALYWSIGILAVSALWLATCMVLRPDRVRQAAQHAAEHHGGTPVDDPLRY
jgi:amino acid transporter